MPARKNMWEFGARLKTEPRKGWTRIPRIRRIESVADHSYGVALLTLLEAENRGLNLERALKLSLIHDLEEAITGDLTPADKEKLSAERVSFLKESARFKILGVLPSNRKRDFELLWRDLDLGLTKEARLVKDLDKLEMALQAKKYETSGAAHRQLAVFYESAVDRIEDPALKKIARGLTRTGN
jgi:5'-deoxynucleotidase